MPKSAGDVVREFTRAMLEGDLDHAFNDLATDDIVMHERVDSFRFPAGLFPTSAST